MELEQLRFMVANAGQSCWLTDAEVPPEKYRSEARLRELLWPEDDERHALGTRLEEYLCTLLDASSYAFFGAVWCLNDHLSSNGRMLFRVNEENLARLLHFFFHGTRDPNDILFFGLPTNSLDIPKARIPSWMESELVERRLARSLRRGVVTSTHKSAQMIFVFVAMYLLETTGLNEDALPDVDEVMLEAKARRSMEMFDNRDGVAVPQWSVSPPPVLARVLDRLYELYKYLMAGSLEHRATTIRETAVSIANEIKESMDVALEKARALRAEAQRSHGDPTACRLAEAAEERAKRLAMLEWCAETRNTFLSPLFSVPEIALDSEMMRAVLSCLGVEVLHAGKSPTARLDLFEHVFRLRDYLAETNVQGGNRARFGGIIDTNGKYAYVHCIAPAQSAERAGGSSQSWENQGAGVLPGSAGGGAKPGGKKKKRQGAKRR